MSNLEYAALEWLRAREAFLGCATVLDATTRLPRLAKPSLLDDLANAEGNLAAACRDRSRQTTEG